MFTSNLHEQTVLTPCTYDPAARDPTGTCFCGCSERHLAMEPAAILKDLRRFTSVPPLRCWSSSTSSMRQGGYLQGECSYRRAGSFHDQSSFLTDLPPLPL